jgi:SAM-dependent methyltransferase
MQTKQIDNARLEAFQQNVVAMYNDAALALMTSIGHRTRLFDTMGTMESATSQEIADAAKLNERYVREWLNAMVVGGIIEYDPDTNTYSLPAEHAACLTREATPDNMAVMAQYFSILGHVEDKIVNCFQHGGGVPYRDFHRFHQVMAEDSGQTVLPALLDSILPLAPGIPQALKNGIDVLDIGCGSGRAAVLMGKTFPESRIVGYDLCDDAIFAAQEEAEREGLENVRFEIKDVTTFNEQEQYDLITAFDAIHDQARPDLVLKEIYAALRPGGVFLMQDIAASSHVHQNLDHPIGPLIYTISTMHCMTVSLAQNGMGLGTAWGEELAHSMLKDAGFIRFTTTRLPHDIFNTFFVATKD